MLSELTCGAQVYKPKAADVIIMRDYLHGEKVKEATLRYGHVDMHKKELKDKAAKAARREDKKEAARVSAGSPTLCVMVGFLVQSKRDRLSCALGFVHLPCSCSGRCLLPTAGQLTLHLPAGVARGSV
jgi:hypothetical protein